MTDDEFLCAFERCTIARRDWTHESHVRMAWLYLTRIPSDGEVFDRVRIGIKKLNSAFVRRQQMRCWPGPAKPKDPRGLDGYHETITVFFMRRLHQLMWEHNGARTAAEWVAILYPQCGMASLQEYYTPEVLWSAGARAQWVEPDRKALK